jgi:DNA polymerase-3 subunit epsilon
MHRRRNASALPRHKSYGLGKLCELYGIELEKHHRALCDARATGHLLNLKREGCAPDRAEEAA